jgi:hypothetical protein
MMIGNCVSNVNSSMATKKVLGKEVLELENVRNVSN